MDEMREEIMSDLVLVVFVFQKCVPSVSSFHFSLFDNPLMYGILMYLLENTEERCARNALTGHIHL